MNVQPKLRATIEECLEVPEVEWKAFVHSFFQRIEKQLEEEPESEHWKLWMTVELDPRDWGTADDEGRPLGYGLLDRWGGAYEIAADCSGDCYWYDKLPGNLGMDWGHCRSPNSHRQGKLTFEHQGCYAFEAARYVAHAPSPEVLDEALDVARKYARPRVLNRGGLWFTFEGHFGPDEERMAQLGVRVERIRKQDVPELDSEE